MAKEQKRSNREIRKPKQVKAAAAAPGGILVRKDAGTSGASKKKKG